MSIKISRFEADNFKRLRHVELTPDGTMQVISGRNAQGKTSVLDAWVMALQYATGKKVNFKPVRDGEERATVKLELSEGEVVKFNLTHTFTPDGKHDIKLESPEGARFSSPQRMLDEIVGRLSFDPLAFSSAPDKEQLATLLSVVDLGDFNTDANTGKRLSTYEARTGVNGRIKDLEGQVKDLQVPPADLPEQVVSSAEVLEQLRAAQDTNAWREKTGRALAETSTLVEDLRARLMTAIEEQTQLQNDLAALPPYVDVSQFQTQLANLEQTNALIREGIDRANKVRNLDALKAESAALTAQIEALDQEKADALAAAKLPLDGLGFTEDGVTYQGQPLSQASGAEQLRVSLAIAMALNPTLRVIRVADASLLDADNLKLVEAMAAENDFQIWLEVVGDAGGVGVVIEDGQVA
jgi:hypothetical protein